MQIKLRFKFTQPVSSIGHRGVFFRNRLISFLMNRAKHAQRTDIDKLLRYHIQFTKSIDKVFRLQIIHPVKLPFVGTFGDTGTMDDIIELIICSLMAGKLRTQFIGVCKIQFQNVYLTVSQIFPAAARTDTRPHAELPLQRLFHDETSDKSTGSCY